MSVTLAIAAPERKNQYSEEESVNTRMTVDGVVHGASAFTSSRTRTSFVLKGLISRLIAVQKREGLVRKRTEGEGRRVAGRWRVNGSDGQPGVEPKCGCNGGCATCEG